MSNRSLPTGLLARLDRRRFLLRSGQASAALALATCLPRGVRAAGPLPKLAYPFMLGVASGDPLSDAVVIWTRLAPAPQEPFGGMPVSAVSVRFQVARDEHFHILECEGDAWAHPERGHAVHVDVRGLSPARHYYYRFFAEGHVSPVGRTRTAPAHGHAADTLRFAFASCQHYETGHYTAYEHMCEEDLDLVVFLGDYIYEGVPQDNQPRRHTGDGEPLTLDDYRRRHALYRSDVHLQTAHARFPWIVSWDDHEVDNDYSDEVPQDPALQSREAFVARRAAAYRAYWENMPLRAFAEPSGPDMQLFRKLSFGSLAEFSVLDTRQYRSVTEPCGDGATPTCDTMRDPSRTMLGDAQERWLLQNLARSGARWNVLAQQVPFVFMDVGTGPEVVVRGDKWDAYPHARQRVVDFLDARRPRNPVILTGDVHNSWLTLLESKGSDGQVHALATELTGTSITSGGDGSEQTDAAPNILARNPHVLFHNNRRGYVSCTLTEKTWTTHYRVVPYVTRQGAPLETRASFVIEDGDARAKPA